MIFSSVSLFRSFDWRKPEYSHVHGPGCSVLQNPPSSSRTDEMVFSTTFFFLAPTFLCSLSLSNPPVSTHHYCKQLPHAPQANTTNKQAVPVSTISRFCFSCPHCQSATLPLITFCAQCLSPFSRASFSHLRAPPSLLPRFLPGLSKRTTSGSWLKPRPRPPPLWRDSVRSLLSARWPSHRHARTQTSSLDGWGRQQGQQRPRRIKAR